MYQQVRTTAVRVWEGSFLLMEQPGNNSDSYLLLYISWVYLLQFIVSLQICLGYWGFYFLCGLQEIFCWNFYLLMVYALLVFFDCSFSTCHHSFWSQTVEISSCQILRQIIEKTEPVKILLESEMPGLSFKNFDPIFFIGGNSQINLFIKSSRS